MAGPDSGAEQAFLEALDGVFEDLDLAPDDKARGKLLDHYRLLVRWNRRMNLTTVRDPQAIAIRHFGESLFLAREVPLLTGSVLDVGSGAGFPGLPLAASRPSVVVTLLEAVQRKAVFLREVSRAWGNVAVRDERLESLSGTWDASVMRAVAAESALPHLARLSGRAALLTSMEGAQEVQNTGFFDWQAPIPLPWGDRRVLLQGRRVASE